MKKHKHALVTGGTSGIGEAITQALLKEGYFVITNYIDSSQAEKLQRKYKDKPIDFVKGDVTNRSEVETMRMYIKKKYKQIYLLVNNAGIMKDRTLQKMSFAEFDSVLQVNLVGTFNVTKMMLDLIEIRGRIINISSISGIYGQFGQTNYSASKGGVIAFTKSLAKEVASRDITVNAIAPGVIDTPLTQKIDKKILANLRKKIPLGRLGKPKEIANAVVFLASPKASYITRHVLCIDGGLSF